MIIGLTGLAACGKSTISRYLKNKHKYSHLVFSDVLVEEAKKRGLISDSDSLEEMKKVLSKLGDDWRKETGKDFVIAEKLIEIIKEKNMKNVVVDGFRAPGEVGLFKRTFDSFILVYVDASLETRFKRRKMDDTNATLDDVIKRDENDVQNKGMDKVFNLADFKINNNSSKESVYRQVEKIISDLDTP